MNDIVWCKVVMLDVDDSYLNLEQYTWYSAMLQIRMWHNNDKPIMHKAGTQ